MRFLALGILTLATLAFGNEVDDCVNSGTRPLQECSNLYSMRYYNSADNGILSQEKISVGPLNVNASADVIAKAAAMSKQAEAESQSAIQNDQIHSKMLNNGASLITAVSRDTNTIATLEKLQAQALQELNDAKAGMMVFGKLVGVDGAVIAAKQAAYDHYTEELARTKEDKFANESNLAALNDIAKAAGAAPVNQPTP